MAGEGQLLAWGEDTQPVIGHLALQQERGFGKVGPSGDALHGLRVQSFGADDDRDRIAEERLVGKDVDLLESELHGTFRILKRL
jgi:hypothetical protein